jgi:hypothetical protein
MSMPHFITQLRVYTWLVFAHILVYTSEHGFPCLMDIFIARGVMWYLLMNIIFLKLVVVAWL